MTFPSFGMNSQVQTNKKSTTFLQHGYFSDEAAERLRINAPKSLSLLNAIKDAVSRVHADIMLLDNVQFPARMWIGFGLWERTLESCQAAAMLAERGMIGSAIAVLRTGYECMFHACALWKDPSVFERIQAQAKYDLYKVAKRARDQFGEHGLSPQVWSKVDQLRDKPPGTGLTVEDAAKIAGLERAYDSIFVILSSMGAHASGRSLEEYAPRQVAGGLQTVLGPKFKGSDKVFRGALECMRVGQLRFREHFSSVSYGPPIPKAPHESPGHPPY